MGGHSVLMPRCRTLKSGTVNSVDQKRYCIQKNILTLSLSLSHVPFVSVSHTHTY